jgi:branched-chain amino acid transport system permease protein
LIVVAALLIVALPFWLRYDYYRYVVTLIMVNGMIAVGCAIIMRAGRLNMAQAAVMGAGSYLTAYFVLHHNVHFLLIVPAAAILGGICGLLLGLLSLRLAGYFFAIATMAFSEVFYYLILIAPGLGGKTGISGVPSPGVIHIGGWTVDFGTNSAFFYICLVLLGIATYVLYRFSHSKTGDAISALGDDETLAAAVGINRVRYRLIATIAGCAIAGAAGALNAYLNGGVSQSSVQTLNAVTYILMVIIGGSSFVAGPVLGAGVLVIVMIVTRQQAQWSLLSYGLVFLAVVYLAPNGFIARALQLWRFGRRRLRPGAEAPGICGSPDGGVLAPEASAGPQVREG